MNSSFLYDPLGPVGTRRARHIAWAANLVGVLILAAVLVQLGTHGQLDPTRWAILADPATGVPRALWQGYVATVKAAAIAMVLALAVGLVMAAGRLSVHRPIRLATGAVVEGFRGVPLLLLMLFAALALPQMGIDLSLLAIVVLSLVAYNSSVLCEIFRGGILSIDKGQSEAAEAMGLGRIEILRKILLPQAIPKMLPVIISQMVILLKDTSLGFIVGYAELLRSGRSLVEYYGNQYSLQIYVAVAVMYIATNFLISYLARRVAARQQRGRPGKSSGHNTVPLMPAPAAAANH
ncbi:MAG: amino acid ABC transporter permease [Comamonadaceae bacterium]|nr:MAG: amino acid ABC transporter permease [Comamonadaceae bacterium]